MNSFFDKAKEFAAQADPENLFGKAKEIAAKAETERARIYEHVRAEAIGEQRSEVPFDQSC